MTVLFTHISGLNRGRVEQFSAAAERIRIGRTADCEVRVSPMDTIVSSQHAVVTLTPRGYVIQDLASRNGTLVNGQAIERAPISTGDTIQLGGGGPVIRFDVVDEADRRLADVDYSVVTSLLEASDAVEKYMSSYLADLGLSPSKFNALKVLREEAQHAVQQAELSAKLTVTGASITGVLDRLERDRLVSRENHPTDRRANLVRLTEEGETLIQTAGDLHAIRMAELLLSLDEEERRTLVALLAKITEAAKKKL
jgi:DNA-binding MarR family transcriptional regulator